MNLARPRASTLKTSLLALAAIAALDASVAIAAQPQPVLLVIANRDFHHAEYAATRTALEARGLEVVVAAGDARTAFPQAVGAGRPVQPDLALSAASATDYAAIAFVGGWGASSYQYAFEGTYNQPFYRPQTVITRDVNRLIGEFTSRGKPVAGVCHGVTVLAWARVDGVSPLQGRVVVGPAGGVPGFRYRGVQVPDAEQPARWQIEMNGATMLTAGSVGNPMTSTDDVIVDGRIITAENWDSAPRLAELLAQAIASNAE
jgi:putative intracellular protease/amidase